MAPASDPMPRRPPDRRSLAAGAAPGQVYDGPMGLSLLAGPANAGKVALLLERYLARLGEEPFLIVPNRGDVDRVERDLLSRSGCLLGGSIGTFDDLFARIAAGDRDRRPVAGDAQRTLIARRAVGLALGDGGTPLARSARVAGFADALLTTLAELEAGLLDPDDVDGELAALYAAYRRELDRLGLWDRDLLRRRACERLLGDLGAWHGEPVFAYGFEDLTAAEWSLLEGLAGRADVDVSLPYEPGRTAFASLRRTAEDLAQLAGGRVEELGARSSEYAAPALAHLERSLVEPAADELLGLLRDGTPAEAIAVVVPSVERWRAPLETAFASLGIPFAIEPPLRLAATPFGHALLSLLRFAWLGGGRRELYAFLRSPYSGIARAGVDFAEGRLRGRAVDAPDRVEEETERFRDAPLVPLRELRAAESPLAGARGLLGSMVRSAYGLEAPPSGEQSRLDLRTYAAATRLLDELEGWEALGEPLGTDDLVAALDRLEVTPGAAAEPGRIAVVDLLRARTRRFDVVVVLGLEEGSLPRRSRSSPFLDDDRRRELGRRLERPDAVSRDRYLFYTACTRATRRLLLVREAASDDGAPREASPFWDEARAVFEPEDVSRATRRRALSKVTWPIDAAPTEHSPTRTTGHAGCAGPGPHSSGGRRSGARSCSNSSAAARRSAPPSSSGSSTAPRPGSSSG